MRVLLVEDNPGDAELIETYLEGVARSPEDHLIIDHVESLDAALEAAREGPDVGIFDVNLPDAGPEETTAAIGKLHEEFAIIVMTGQAGEEIELQALKAGADEFLSKDQIDANVLNRCVDHAIQRHNMLDALRRRERELEKYRIIVEHSTDAVSMKDREGRYRLVNERFRHLIGESEAEILGHSVSDVLEDSVAEEVKERDRDVLRASTERTDEEERGVEGEERTFLTTRIPYDVEGEPEGTIAISRDITERRQMREDLEHRALYDRMTGLPNRALFRDRLEQTIERSRRRGTTFALAFLDLDDFKAVNDSLGHPAGDELLQSVAERLRGHLRAEDTIARIGGDEFMIVFERIDDRDQIERVGERLRELFDDPFPVGKSSVHMSVSIGFSFPDIEALRSESVQEAYESLNRAADRAMYRAKERTGTGWEFADPENQGSSSRRVQRENRIREGLENDEFLPHFQPVVRLSDGAVIAFEMLARWSDPERGMVSPGEFIPVAEQTALIDDLCESVLERACRRFAEDDTVPEMFDSPCLYVNVSATQLGKRSAMQRLLRIIDGELPSSMNVVLEVTETALLRHRMYADEVREAGYRIFVDDFGTGHSSLSRLKEMPVDGIKLDMEFVHGIGEGTDDAAIVEMVAQLGQRLDLPVVAEGVETREQYEFLEEVGCTSAQGYWLARPGPFEGLAEIEIPPS